MAKELDANADGVIDDALVPIIGATGSTDNVILTANGTGGKTVQANPGGVAISDTGEVTKAATAINTQTDSYTLVIGDNGKTIEMDKASACTLTIPANASVAFPVGTIINIVQIGAGQVTVALTSDTLRSKSSNVKLTGQYSGATAYKRAATEWVLIGDLTA